MCKQKAHEDLALEVIEVHMIGNESDSNWGPPRRAQGTTRFLYEGDR